MKKAYHHINHKVSCILAYIFVAFMLLSCNEEQQLLPMSGSATLKLTLGTPQMNVATRGISDDPNMEGTWSDDEMLMDGRYLKRLTLLLVEGSTLVGKQDFAYDNTTTTEQEATFKNLTSGQAYQLIAVANYSELTNFPDIAGLTVNTDISNVLNTLISFHLDTGTDFIAPKQEQPLTLVKDIIMPVTGGTYEVKGELVRTYARLRIEVENRSGQYNLMVNSLSFSEGFAQRYENLLTEDFTLTPKGDINVTSEDALTAFTYTSEAPLSIPFLDLSTDTENANSAVVFDAYLHETENGTAGYSYTLNLGYDQQKVETKTVWKVTETVTRYSDLEEESYYLIGSGNVFLAAGVSTVEVLEIEDVSEREFDMEQAPVLWKIASRSGTTVSIQSALSGNDGYITIPTSNNNKIQLGSSSSDLTLSDNNGRIQMYKYSNRNYYYIRISDDKVTANRNNATNFTFYKVEKTTKNVSSTLTSNFEIPLTTIEASGSAVPTTSIRRNDFIQVLVTVSYNENTGEMEFHVKDWQTTQLPEIEFE